MTTPGAGVPAGAPRGEGRVYYGWVMLGVAIAMSIATMPGQTVVASLFNRSIRESLGLSVTGLSSAYTIGTILAGLPLSWVGRCADRYGIRRVTGVVAVGFAGALVFLSQGVSSVVLLVAAYFLIRFLGQGSLSMLAGHTIAMWFERKLGTVHSILSVGGFAAGSALLPIPVALLITGVGWRTTLVVLAGMVLVLVIPSVLFLFRNRPEDIGQHLDGDSGEHATHDVMHGGKPPRNDPAFTVRQTLATRAYYIIVSIMCAGGLIGTALIFHMQTMIASAGLEGTERQAAMGIQAWPIAFGVGTLLAGPLVDRVKPWKLLPIAPLCIALSCVVCLLGVRVVPSAWVVPTLAAGMGVFGVSQALGVSVGNPTIARYFGRTHHGAIRGTVVTALVMATGGGPLIAGAAYELAGESFVPILAVFTVVCVPMVFTAMTLRPPTPPSERDLRPDPDEPDPSGAGL